LETEEVKKTYLSAFERFYQAVGANWPKFKVERVLLIFKRSNENFTLNCRK